MGSDLVEADLDAFVVRSDRYTPRL